jgi:MFS transporter, DHA3 family, macrolide efflux protein
LIAAIGGSSGLLTPLVSASLQERTPKHLLARVFGVFNTGSMAFAVMGMTVFGWTADAFGPSISLVAIAGVQLGAAAVTVAVIPWCRRLMKEPAQPVLLRNAS